MKAPLHAATIGAAEQCAFLQEALASTAAVQAAYHLGLLDRIAERPQTSEEVAADCGLGIRGTRMLLSALSALGLAETAPDGRYRATARDSLLRDIGELPWNQLTQVVREDRPLFNADTPDGAESAYTGKVERLGKYLFAAAENAAAFLCRRLAENPRVLDVGAGAAPWSIALAARVPDARITAIDLPRVLRDTRNAVANAGLSEQFEFQGGDLFEMPLQERYYDLVIAGNIFHLFDEQTNEMLARRLFESVRRNGFVAVMDVLPNERMDGPRPVMLYALSLLLRTRAGQVYPFSTYAGWLRRAGFEAVERVDLTASPPICLVLAQRPSES